MPPSPHGAGSSGEPITTVPCETFPVLHALLKDDLDKKVRHAAVHEDRGAVASGAAPAGAEKVCWGSTDRYVQETRSELDVEALRGVGLTSVRWRVLAGVVSGARGRWPAELAKERGDYAVARASLCPAQTATVVDKETQQLWWEIEADIKRTRKDESFFEAAETMEAMGRILFVYAKLHPAVGYIQGMNAILAQVVYVVWADAEAAGKEYLGVFGTAFREQDAFALFSHIMEMAQLLFTSEDIILTRCHAVQLMLKEKDGELEKALTEMDILPELYMLRWIRILFAQLYSITDTIKIWDTILLFGLNSGIIEHICITLLSMIRVSSKFKSLFIFLFFMFIFILFIFLFNF